MDYSFFKFNRLRRILRMVETTIEAEATTRLAVTREYGMGMDW
jgi:hypothetical protein